MKRCALAILICLVAHPAYAQRVRDMSLSPEDSFKTQNIPPTRNTAYESPFPGQNPYSNPQKPNLPVNPNAANTNYRATNSYMASYCDPNFKPALSRNSAVAGMNACLEEYKRTACQQFYNAPAEVQSLLDRAMICNHYGGEWGGSVERDGEVPDSMSEYGCAGLDLTRINLLKKYWGKEDVMYAILFFSDAMITAEQRCANPRGYGQ